jgi:hypothetical protein
VKKIGAKVTAKQGDRIGRIFADCEIVSFAKVFLIKEIAQTLGYFFRR